MFPGEASAFQDIGTETCEKNTKAQDNHGLDLERPASTFKILNNEPGKI